MKISVRLAVCFGALILMMCVVAGVGVKNLWALSDTTNEIVNDRYAKVALDSQISDKVNTAARSLRNAIIALDQATTDKYLEPAANSTKDVTEHMTELEKRLNTPKGAELFGKLKDARGEYAKHRNKIIELIRAQQKYEAGEYLFKEVIPAQDKYFAALKELVAFQVTLMDKSVVKNSEASTVASNLMLGASGVAVLLSALCAILITRSITRPLNEAVQVATAVASGDLTVQILSKMLRWLKRLQQLPSHCKSNRTI